MISLISDNSARLSAITYLRDQLRRGNSFALLSLKELDLDNGSVFSLTPAEYSAQDTEELDRGHIVGGLGVPRQVGRFSGIAVPKESADHLLVEQICDVLCQPDSFCLMENSLAAPQDPWLQKAKSRILTFGSDVYHLVMTADEEPTAVQDAIREAKALPIFIGAVGRFTSGSKSWPLRRHAITLEELNSFAEAITSVFSVAYDGEGYICWYRQPIISSRTRETGT